MLNKVIDLQYLPPLPHFKQWSLRRHSVLAWPELVLKTRKLQQALYSKCAQWTWENHCILWSSQEAPCTHWRWRCSVFSLYRNPRVLMDSEHGPFLLSHINFSSIGCVVFLWQMAWVCHLSRKYNRSDQEETSWLNSVWFPAAVFPQFIISCCWSISWLLVRVYTHGADQAGKVCLDIQRHPLRVTLRKPECESSEPCF